jgi:hypothetical protein
MDSFWLHRSPSIAGELDIETAVQQDLTKRTLVPYFAIGEYSEHML